MCKPVLLKKIQSKTKSEGILLDNPKKLSTMSHYENKITQQKYRGNNNIRVIKTI